METYLGEENSVQPDDPGPEVAVGSHVEVELIAESGETERLAFDLVSDAEADFFSGFLGVGTPLAQAILGRRAGSAVPYQVGDVTQGRVLAVAAGARPPDGQAAADRQAVIQKAISQSDLAESVRFALTVDQKWGDTDPEGIAENWEDISREEEPGSA